MIGVFSLSGLLILTTSTVMAAVMLVRPHTALHRVWGLFCILVAMWGLGAYNIGVATDSGIAVSWWKFAYVGVIFIPAMFTHFVHIFLEKKANLFIGTLYVISFLYLVANIGTVWFISDVHMMFDSLYYLSPTPLYNSYMTLWVMLIVYTHALLFREFLQASKERRRQIQYFFLGSLVGFVGGSFAFLPVYGISIYPYPNVSVSLYPLIMGYAIFKYRLMDLKVVMTQLFVALLWVFILTRILIAPFGSNEQILNIFLLVMTVIVGILLVRSVLQEIKTREKIEKLAENLEDANVRLRELDRQKSEFLSMAAHQLRTPLTSIKGYASLMLEGSYGDLPQKVNVVLETIFSSSARMVDTVSDFLNVSRIEQGKMEYRMEYTDLGIMAKSVVAELALSAKEKKLNLEYHDDGKGPYPIYADTSKLEHVISNIVDNAIKYTPKGSVTVRVEKDIARNIGRVKVIDTGAGIPAEALPKLFDKFVRARNANEINVTGTGLGLYVAREMITKHNGKIWAESKGENRGSIFVVEIPLSDPRINSAQT